MTTTTDSLDHRMGDHLQAPALVAVSLSCTQIRGSRLSFQQVSLGIAQERGNVSYIHFR